ncbi:acetyltransferase [Deltaproteobacteria bacterium]|nr:acetyltransferase [Deltaproteobacteria bacterium]GHV53133.1 acetyltransferase [Deltaproteobacteria bacterium]
MTKQKLRERLILKEVGLNQLEQFTQLWCYVFQVTNEELFKSGYEDGELIRSQRPMLEKADVFGWFDGDNLISQICVYPCQVNIHGKIFEMGGLTGVGTYPEYAGMGLMNDLIRLSLKTMREKGQLISYLFPYSIPFYRHRGWEILCDKISFTIKDSQLPKRVEVPGFVERMSVGHPDVIRTYDRYARWAHGALIRNELDWEEYWRWENEDERTAAVYYTEGHEPTGLLIYWLEDDIFHIKEMVYLDQEARRGLWNFITAHFSMIDEVKGETFKNEPLAFYLEDSQIIETIEPYFMARIVDVRTFLENFPFVDFYETFHFKLSDPIAEWNRGIFSITGKKDGKNIVGNEPVGRAVSLDVQTLTSMLMNYRRPSYFADMEHLEADQDAVTLLENIISSRQPYFSDYF